MAGWFRMRQRLVRRLGAGLAAGGLLAATVAVPAQAADGAGAVHRPAPRLPKVAPATGVGVLHARKIRTRNAAAARYRPGRWSGPAVLVVSSATVRAGKDPSRKWMQLVDRLTTRSVEGGHCSMLDRPEEFNEAVERFLREVLGLEDSPARAGAGIATRRRRGADR